MVEKEAMILKGNISTSIFNSTSIGRKEQIVQTSIQGKNVLQLNLERNIAQKLPLAQLKPTNDVKNVGGRRNFQTVIFPLDCFGEGSHSDGILVTFKKN